MSINDGSNSSDWPSERARLEKIYGAENVRTQKDLDAEYEFGPWINDVVGLVHKETGEVYVANFVRRPRIYYNIRRVQV